MTNENDNRPLFHSAFTQPSLVEADNIEGPMWVYGGDDEDESDRWREVELSAAEFARQHGQVVAYTYREENDGIPVRVFRLEGGLPGPEPHFYMDREGNMTPSAGTWRVPQPVLRVWWRILKDELGHWWWENWYKARRLALKVWRWPRAVEEFDASDVTYPSITAGVMFRHVMATVITATNTTEFDNDLIRIVMGDSAVRETNDWERTDPAFDYYAMDPTQAPHGADGGVPMTLAELIGADERMDRIDRVLEDGNGE